jgi:hypothetical protein
MSMRLLSTAFAVLVLPGLAAAQTTKDPEEHPYAKVKVGDWVTYTMTAEPMTVNEFTTTSRVAAKDDKNVTIKMGGKITLMGNTTDFPESEIKIDLTQPYDAHTNPNDKKGDTKVEKVGEGKEKVKVGGKEYDTTWTKTKVTTKVMGKESVVESTVWMSKDVPMGMVKMESKFEGGNSKIEVKEFGTGKK